jgi:hypothetical protein
MDILLRILHNNLLSGPLPESWANMGSLAQL